MRIGKVARGVAALPLKWRARLGEPRLRPMSERERLLVEELRAGLARVGGDGGVSVPLWAAAQERLLARAREGDPRAFTRWDVIRETMFPGNRLWIAAELRSLRRDPRWETLWRGAIRESIYGLPERYHLYPESSGNLIHHAYHVQQLTARTGKPVSSLDLVFEFGGGYGSMRRLAHNLGFKGRYIILDLPPFTQLQRFYLSLLGIPVEEPRAGDDPGGSGTWLTSDPGIIRRVRPGPGSLFIATWSLSETPLELRGPFLGFIRGFESFLIAYQDRFPGSDNARFFEGWRAELGDEFVCEQWAIPQLPGNRYFLGRRAAAASAAPDARGGAPSVEVPGVRSPARA